MELLLLLVYFFFFYRSGHWTQGFYTELHLCLFKILFLCLVLRQVLVMYSWLGFVSPGSGFQSFQSRKPLLRGEVQYWSVSFFQFLFIIISCWRTQKRLPWIWTLACSCLRHHLDRNCIKMCGPLFSDLNCTWAFYASVNANRAWKMPLQGTWTCEQMTPLLVTGVTNRKS